MSTTPHLPTLPTTPVVVVLSAPVPPDASRDAVRAAFASTVDFNGALPDILLKETPGRPKFP